MGSLMPFNSLVPVASVVCLDRIITANRWPLPYVLSASRSGTSLWFGVSRHY